jgi:hypothetical protein
VIQHPSLPTVGWWNNTDTVARELRNLLPIYDGNAEPANYNRVPPERWPDCDNTATSLR